jgi:hypothetical protein
LGVREAGQGRRLIEPRRDPGSMTLARQAEGMSRLVGPLLLALAALFPVVLFVPLVRTKVWLLSYHDVVLARIAYDLFRTDLLLFGIVVVLGMIVPALKIIMMILCWYWFDAGRRLRIVKRMAILSKLSMLDTILLSVSIVAFKGVGVGIAETRFGLYFFVVMSVGSFALSLVLESICSKSA